MSPVLGKWFVFLSSPLVPLPCPHLGQLALRLLLVVMGRGARREEDMLSVPFQLQTELQRNEIFKEIILSSLQHNFSIVVKRILRYFNPLLPLVYCQIALQFRQTLRILFQRAHTICFDRIISFFRTVFYATIFKKFKHSTRQLKIN